MKDSADTSIFIGQHVFLRERLLDMDVYVDDEAVFCLFLGLPATPVWQQFKSGLIHRISWDHDAFVSTIISTSSSTESNPLAPHTFESCAACIISEASRLVDMQTIAPSRPETEHGHPERAAGAVYNTIPITRLPKHKYNPGGVLCTTPGCERGDHDHDHCYAKGGRMEGQAPWQRKKKKKSTGTHAAASATSVSATIPAFATPANPAPFTLIYASTGSTFSPLISPSPHDSVTHIWTVAHRSRSLETLNSFGRIPPILSPCARPMAAIWPSPDVVIA